MRYGLDLDAVSDGYATQDQSLWWYADKALAGNRWRHMLAYVRQLDEAQFTERERDLRHGQAYDVTCELMGTEMVLVGARRESPPIENVVASGTDTMVAHLCRDNVRLAVRTDGGGEFELEEYAKAIERILAAESKRVNLHGAKTRTCRDGAVFGLGYTKIYELDQRPAIDRVLKDEIVIDHEEARFFPPRSIFQRRFVDRHVLAYRFARGKRADEIKEAIAKANVDGRWCSYRKMGRHMVAVVEGWRLPSGPGAGDGRHTISIEGCDLVDEPWTRDYFPILEWCWSERLTGYGGRGIAEQGLPVQNRINRHDRFIATSQDRIAIPRVYVQKGAGIEVQMDNRVGALVKVAGRKPDFEIAQAVSPEIYGDRREKRQTFYEALGISQVMASAKKYPGMDSAPAQREFRDQTTERHSTQELSLETWHVTVGERILDVIEDIAEREGTYRTTYVSRETRETIEWDEVKLARDQYSLCLEPANGLARSLPGQRQEIEEDYAAGVISRDEYRKQRGLPDIDAARALEGAVTSLADAICSGLVRNRPFAEIAPDPMDDLEFILRRVRLKRSHLKAHRASHAMIERFDQWIEQAEYAAGMVPPPPAPPAAAPPVPAEALAQAGPEMLPNAPPAAQMPAGMPPPM